MPTVRITANEGEYDVELTAEQYKIYSEARSQGRLHVLVEKGHYVMAEEVKVIADKTEMPDWDVQEKGHVFAMGNLVESHGKVNTFTGKRLTETGPVETVETAT